MRKEGTHDEDQRRIACSRSPLCTVVGLCDHRYARKHDIRCVPANGQEPASVVRAVRLQLYSGRSPGDVHAGRYLPGHRQLPTSSVVPVSVVARLSVSTTGLQARGPEAAACHPGAHRKNKPASAATQAVDAKSPDIVATYSRSIQTLDVVSHNSTHSSVRQGHLSYLD